MGRERKEKRSGKGLSNGPAGFMIRALLLALCLAGCAAREEQTDGSAYRHMTAQEAASLMEESEGYLIVDVRREDEYAASHIPDAVNIPLDTIGEWEIAALPDKRQTLFVYCQSGVRSAQAAASLAALGYSDVIDMGGIADWTGETVSGTASWASEATELVVIAGEDALPAEWSRAAEACQIADFTVIYAKGTEAKEAGTEAVSILYHNDGSVRGVRVKDAQENTYNVQCGAVLLLTDADPSLYAVFQKDDAGSLVTDAFGALDRTDGGNEIVPTKCGVKLNVPEREQEEIPEEEHYSYGVYAFGTFTVFAEGEEEAQTHQAEQLAAAIAGYLSASAEKRE